MQDTRRPGDVADGPPGTNKKQSTRFLLTRIHKKCCVGRAFTSYQKEAKQALAVDTPSCSA